ncbi:MAG: NusG domain II-containing protein [Lachnospiraceae bacterium]|nr:NusG domain II-containing protein [Lachnospiraceae bacterium]
MIKKNDLLLILGLIIVIIIGLGVKSLYFNGSSSEYVEIRVDGEIVAEYSLDEDREEVFVAEDGGYNKVVIKAGAVCVSEADCPDKNCVHKGTVSEVNETIICLPHKFVVKLCGSAEGSVPDIVAE